MRSRVDNELSDIEKEDKIEKSDSGDDDYDNGKNDNNNRRD